MNGFILKNLPDRSCLESLQERYPQVSADVVECYLHYMRASAEISTTIQDLIHQHGLSPGRMAILMMLNGAQEPRSAAEIADWCSVSRATISGLMDGLVKDGLITREPDATDRRMIRVDLTEKGREHLNSLLPSYFNQITNLFGVLTAEERENLKHIVTKLRNTLNDGETHS